MRDRFNASQYLNNAMSIMKNWSKDSVRNKPLYEEPMVDAQTWSSSSSSSFECTMTYKAASDMSRYKRSQVFSTFLYTVLLLLSPRLTILQLY